MIDNSAATRQTSAECHNGVVVGWKGVAFGNDELDEAGLIQSDAQMPVSLEGLGQCNEDTLPVEPRAFDEGFKFVEVISEMSNDDEGVGSIRVSQVLSDLVLDAMDFGLLSQPDPIFADLDPIVLARHPVEQSHIDVLYAGGLEFSTAVS